MKLPRRNFLHLAASAAALPAVSRIARAQAYPSRPVRLIVGYPPGTTTDILARLMSQWLSERLGQHFVIENRPGASGNIATESVARAPADGHTLLLIAAPNVINATLYEKLNFDLARDIAAVSGVTRAPLVVEVSPSFAARTVPELIANAKTNPGKISIATAGTASVSHLTVELLRMRAGIDIVRVPYPSAASAIPDVLANRVNAVVDPIVSSIEHIRAGRLRPLAVTTSIRSEALRSGHGRFPAWVRSQRVGGFWRTQEHVCPNHRQAQQGDQRRLGRRQDKGPPCRPRWHDASRVSRRLSKIHCRRDREVGSSDPSSQHQAGVIAGSRPSPK
jgi:tripartite-type tricarboxylate transporter receptor subunit TctC